MIAKVGTRRAGRWAVVLLMIVISASALIPPSSSVAWAKLETWRQESASAFAKGHRERVVVSDAGRVRLARTVQPIDGLDAAHVWALARTEEGLLYAATGNDGKVFRRSAEGRWTVAYDADDSQALALVARPDGRVFAGTGPSGLVVEVTDPKQPATRPGPDVKYIWGLAADAAGNLYAATGPAGQLWKRSAAAGDWSLLLDSKNPHLLCVAVGPDGSVYAGSDGEGLIYRVDRDGKVSVLYDAPQNEVRSLLVAPDGALYAGTAVDAGGGSTGGGAVRGLSALTGSEGTSSSGGTIRAAAPAQVPKRDTRTPEPTGGTAAPKPPAPGDNTIYRISPDGAVREVFRVKALLFALAWQDERLLVGTGPEGQLYEVRDLGREAAPIARLDHGQILALMAEPKGGVLLGAGEPGAVLRLGREHAASGSLTSDVHDAKLNSRFGALTWRADCPKGTSLTVQVRTGNVSEPDATWSAWSAPLTESGSRPAVPPGRFVQYRVNLATNDPAVTPELRAIFLHYQTVNLAPEISKIDVPDLSEGDGATRQTRLNLRWEASDPNGDDLTYTLHIRKEDWPDWVQLGERPLTEKTYAWDTTAVPAGVYRLRITASDRPSNPPEEALERRLTSDPFLVDHQAPTVAVVAHGGMVTVTLKDDLTRLVKAAYALDGGDWVPIFPDDGLFDGKTETITLTLPDPKPGTHILMVRASDAAGNVGTGDAVFEVP
ncbi:MAG: hypothetical protein IRY99_08595 [Isosphaeraceae bacterium]|nr:hypothetical protein [Isosphaeraceae bacterium]